MSSPNEFMPPFPSVATISSNYITTFDQRNYFIKGSCTYLLTRDFFGGEFDILAEFGQFGEGDSEGQLKSIALRAGPEQIDWTYLHLSGMVTQQDEGLELPATVGNFIISSSDSHLTASLKDSEDLEINCNLKYQTCSVMLKGTYFGRVGGLFGNNNYEPGDDSLCPARNDMETASDILNSWTVSESCRPARTSYHKIDVVPHHVSL